MQWMAALPEGDLPEGARRVVTVGGREMLLINYRGKIYAVGSRCPHLQAKMEKGELTEDGAIVCPRHHSVFELEDGTVREWVPWPPVVGRALGAISQENRLPAYPTKVEDGMVFVDVEGTP